MRHVFLILSTLAVWPFPASAQDDGRLDPQAAEIAQASADFLARQPALAFDWFVSMDQIVDGREKITHIRSGSNLLIRDKGFYSVAERADGLREYFYDGEIFTIAAPEEAFYASAPFDQGFEALVAAAIERAATPVPLWWIMSRTLPEGLLDEVEGAAYLGVVRLAGAEAHHLAFTEYDEDWQVWISTDPERPVPLMMVGTETHKQGWPQYTAYMTNWSFEPAAQDGAFTFVPAEDDVSVAMPQLVTAGQAPATEGEAEAAGEPEAEAAPETAAPAAATE